MSERLEPQQGAMPDVITPMLAVQGDMPSLNADGAFGYEFKWDGVRALARISEGRIRLYSRRGNEITGTYPELAALGEWAGGMRLWLDGEIIAMHRGVPSFKTLQSRMHASPAKASVLSAHTPVTYLVFDVLWIDGRSCMSESYRNRRQLLDELEVAGSHWQISPSYPGGGAAVVRAAEEQGLEGVIAKRLRSPYRPAARSADWLKITQEQVAEVVVGGWRLGQGRRTDTFGSLLLGLPERDGLRYIGHVGTGFTDRELHAIFAELRALARPTSPFRGDVPADKVRMARWVDPRLVGEVVFKSWTADGRLRAPSWRGLRPDKTRDDLAGD